jgi:hypothetical protein
MGIAILVITGIIAFAANIWLVIVAFQRSVLWGIAALFVPFAALVFAIMYWQDAKKPFLISLLASIAMGVSFAMVFPQMNSEQFAGVVEGMKSGEIKPNEAFEQIGKDPGTNLDAPPLSDEMNASVDGATPAAEVAIDETSMPKDKTKGAVKDRGEQVTVEEVVDGSVQTNVVEELVAPTASKEKPASPYPSPGNIQPDPLAVKKLKAESVTVSVKLENIATYKGRYFVITTKDGNQHRGLLKKVNASTLFLTRKLYGGDFDYVLAKKKVAKVEMLKEEYVKEFMNR